MKDLDGKTILLTRAADDAADWTRAIEKRGGRVLHLPSMVCEVVSDPVLAAALGGALERAEWLVLTSRRGVRAVRELVGGEIKPDLSVAAVGQATGEEARRALGRCDLIPREETASSLAFELGELFARRRSGHGANSGDPGEAGARLDGAQVVLAVGNLAGNELERLLGSRGFKVTRHEVYTTKPVPPQEPKRDLAALGLDAIVLASPSAAQGLVNRAEVPGEVQLISIGPTTSRAARGLGLEVTAQAARPTIESILEAIA